VLYSKPYITLRTLLVETRAERGLRQEELAGRLGKSQSFVSKVERGERYLDTIDFVLWCRALGIDPVRVMISIAAEVAKLK
jgi:transcriptional regulator with XRE-family HTH domain